MSILSITEILMPRVKGCSAAAKSKNISAEVRSGRKQSQAVAMTLSACGPKKKKSKKGKY